MTIPMRDSWLRENVKVQEVSRGSQSTLIAAFSSLSMTLRNPTRVAIAIPAYLRHDSPVKDGVVGYSYAESGRGEQHGKNSQL
jgi:hypothetical protein